jgi:hypothetical protein
LFDFPTLWAGIDTANQSVGLAKVAHVCGCAGYWLPCFARKRSVKFDLVSSGSKVAPAFWDDHGIARHVSTDGWNGIGPMLTIR